ncbi:hypothetical protein [Streptomyces erythrochromogenes]|uniref:hypothetical protein n=1 Tax=Streptomyces erythrochromogenes TaxID=285574 RepID=UPI0033D0C0CE
MDLRCLHPGCGQSFNAAAGYEIRSAAHHALVAGHPYAAFRGGSHSTLAHSAQSAASTGVYGLPAQTPKRPAADTVPGPSPTAIGCGLIVTFAVIIALAGSCSTTGSSGPQNDRQKCEEQSSQSDTIRFGDCKGMFPGQPGISGWD